MILRANRLSFRYPTDAAGLDALDLHVRRGSRLAVLGANGAGKTTLFLHFCGLLKPCAGSVEFDGRPLDYSARGLAALRARLALVFQDPDDQLFAATVAEDVSFGPLNIGLAAAEVRRRVDAALDVLGIGDLAARPSHRLSFGQKKRVALAGALAMQPQVLILDEPTAGLDALGSERLLAELAELSRAGATVVISTHDVDLAYGWADEAAILSKGRVLAQGAPHIVLAEPALLAAGGLRLPWMVELERLIAHPRAGALPRNRTEFFAALAHHLAAEGSAQMSLPGICPSPAATPSDPESAR